MTRYADPERCPDCLGPMTFGSSTCPHCGLSLEGPLAGALFQTLSGADDLLARLRERSAAAGSPAAEARPVVGTAVPAVSMPGSPGPAPRRDRHRLSQASVPKILLGLGAVCLLIAALVFLAVSWSAMGVGARTATLVGFTAVAAALSTWAARRDLRAAAESLALVALGLFAFDLFGARDSGWLGDLGTAAFLVVLGSCLAAAGVTAALVARRTPVGALTGAEVVAFLGVGTASGGLTGTDWLSSSASFTVVVVAAAAAAYGAHRERLLLLAGGAGLVSLLAWVSLTLSSLERAFTHPTARELWLELEVWPLLVAAILAAGVTAVRRLPHPARVAGLAAAEVVLAAALLAPFSDESATTATLAGTSLTAGACLVLWFTPVRWAHAPSVSVALGAAWMAAMTVALAGTATERGLDAGSAAWSGTLGTVLPARPTDTFTPESWLLPVTALVMLLAISLLAHGVLQVDRLLDGTDQLILVATVAAGTVVATVALYAVPVWLVVALLLAAAVALATWALRSDRSLALALALGFLVAGFAVSLHTEGLTLAALTVGLVTSLVTHLRWPLLEVSALAGFLGSCALAGTAWTVGALAGADGTWVAATGLLVLGLLVLGAPYVDRTVRVSEPVTLSRLGAEAGALASALGLSLAGLEATDRANGPTWLAVYLTLTGAVVSVMALLRPDRRPAGWLGGALLATASWVRLWDIGVDEPEAYTLPTALALLVVGVLHLRRNPSESTMAALSPGLGLALVPSLIWVVADPVTLRSVLLGAACLGLVLGGARIRWSAPVVYGAVVGAVVVLRHATPIAEAVPRWALIATAGALLIATGITWERRLHEARAVAGYVRSLR